MGSIPKEKNNFVEILRALFTLFIVLNHEELLFDPPLIGRYGYIGVEFFFLLSGFLMAKSTDGRETPAGEIGADTVRFLKKRFGRIYGYFLFGLAFAFAACQIGLNVSLRQMGKNLLPAVYEGLLLRMSGIQTGTFYNSPTWYLSALLLAMLALYPLLLWNRNVFTRILAPLIGLFCIGFIYQRYGMLYVTENWTGWIQAGVLRAAGEIAIGSACYELAKALSGRGASRGARWAYTAVECGAWIFILLLANVRTGDPKYNNDLDFVLLPIMAAGVVLTFSGLSNTSRLLRGRDLSLLTKFGICLYCTHWGWGVTFSLHQLPFSYGPTTLIYLACSMATAAVCLLTVDGVRKATGKGAGRQAGDSSD